MTLTTITEKETAAPKPAKARGRGIGNGGKVPSHQIPSLSAKDIIKQALATLPELAEYLPSSNGRLTNYDRWVRYQRVPKGKNARKRLNWRLQRESVGAVLDLRIDKMKLMVKAKE